MRKPRGKRRPADSESEQDREPRLIKWVGGVTAVLSLAFAVQQVVQLVSDGRERQRQIDELTSVATLQRNSGDYKASWTTFERAVEAAEPTGQLAKLTGQLSEQRRQLREAQEDLAMVWLENMVAKEGESFADLVAPLDPVVNRGIAGSAGPRRADLLAHAGWATFLKWRSGQRGLDPDPQYALALAADAGNPYANVYRAHWLLMTRQEKALPEARTHFAAALASGRVKEHVRRIQLAGLRNLGASSGAGEYFAVVNEMRIGNETITAQARNDLYQMYSSPCARLDQKYLDRFAAVSAADQLATFQALFYEADKRVPGEHPRSDADPCLAGLLEAAGHPDQALPVWTALAKKYPHKGNLVGDRAREAIRRLTPR
jgi:hypothetical protein